MLKRRAAAAVLDLIVQGLIGLTLGALVSRAGPHSVYVALAVAAAWFLAADIALHARAGAHPGQSLGKQLLRIQVVAPGRPARGWRLTARACLRWPGGFVSVAMLPDTTSSPHLSLVHDRLLRTRVVAADSHPAEHDVP